MESLEPSSKRRSKQRRSPHQENIVGKSNVVPVALKKPSKSGFRRVFYWATLVAQFIIASVSLTFLYYNSFFWPLTIRNGVDFGGLVFLLVFLASSVLTQYNFFMAIFGGPGYVPDGWKPLSDEDCTKLQYCDVCRGERFKLQPPFN